MTFVNQIAEIIHGVIDEFQGAANKNDGDKFLIVWRTSGHTQENCSKLADMSMVAFAKILGAVHRSPVLAAYRYHPGLQQRLGTQCRVNITFGLHAGWAIEGAVGSEFKVDASYLSPNVSIVSTVESATSIYNVPILVSEAVVELASEQMADKCRVVDRVKLRGALMPMRLYSLDLDYLSLNVEAPRDPRMKWNLRERFKARQFLEQEKDRRMFNDFQISGEFDKTRDLVKMRRLFTIDFLQMFHMGFQNYIAGEWEVAKRFLSGAQALPGRGDDGPSLALLRFMEHPHNFQAPGGWNGIREL
jgi:class 3 adenylate cyclase